MANPHAFPIRERRRSNLNSLLLLLLANANIQVTNNPAEEEDNQKSAGKSEGLPELGRRRVLVSDDEVTVAELVDNVDGDEVQGRAADCVHKSAVQGGGVGDERDGGLEVGDAGSLTLAGLSVLV